MDDSVKTMGSSDGIKSGQPIEQPNSDNRESWKTHLADILPSMKDVEDEWDCCMHFGEGQKIMAHRFLLRLFSKLLEFGSYDPEEGLMNIELDQQFLDKKEVVQKIINSFYDSKIDLSEDLEELKVIYKFCKMYSVSWLLKIVREAIIEVIEKNVSRKEELFVDIFEYAHAIDCKELKEKCIPILDKSMIDCLINGSHEEEEVSSTTTSDESDHNDDRTVGEGRSGDAQGDEHNLLLGLSKFCMETILKADKVNDSVKEQDLFNLLEAWLKIRETPPNDYLELIKEIRYQNIDQEFMYGRVMGFLFQLDNKEMAMSILACITDQYKKRADDGRSCCSKSIDLDSVTMRMEYNQECSSIPGPSSSQDDLVYEMIKNSSLPVEAKAKYENLAEVKEKLDRFLSSISEDSSQGPSL